MDTSTLAPNDGARSIEAIYAEIERLKQLGNIEHWTGQQRTEAKQLLQVWLDLPDDTPEDDELPPIDHRVEWLWDQLDRLQEIQSESSLESWSEICERPLVVDVDRWVKETTNLLRKGWQQYDRFRFRHDEDSDKYEPKPWHELGSSDSESIESIDGDLARKATLLWMEFDELLHVIPQTRFFEVFTLWNELEQHIDPDGIIQLGRQDIRNQRRSEELKKLGKHREAALWLLPKDQWEQPSECSLKDWANIIKPFNRTEFDEPLTEFFARVELARVGLCPGRSNTPTQALKAHQDDAHTKIREMLDAGSSASDIQELINHQFKGYNQAGLAKFADQHRVELERRQDLADALENLLLRGAPPTINLAEYFPTDWLPMFRVLREGLKFSDEAIVMTVMAGVASMLPPEVRINAWSMEEIPTVWLFHIGSSGTAKSVLLSKLISQPMKKPIAAIDGWNDRERERRKASSEAGDVLPPFRKRNLIYTSPTTQGIRADLAVHGEEVPGILVKDELSSWLKQMAKEEGASVGDVEFWLSSYDGAYSNDVFADDKKSREVRCGKLGVIGTIQPKVFLEQLEAGNANGFNSRPLFVHLPRHRRELIQPDAQSEKLTDKLGEVYLGALEDSNHRYILTPEAEGMFQELFNQLEELSLQANSEEVEALWAKGPGQVLRVAAAVHFIRVATGQEDLVERGFAKKATVVSTRSLQLAAKLVMAGKTRAVELHERAANPMVDMADRVMEMVMKLQGKAQGKGVRLSEIRKSGWSGPNRPQLDELKQLAVMLQSRGLVQLLDSGMAIRVAR